MSPKGGGTTPPLEAKNLESAISYLHCHAYPECAFAVTEHLTAEAYLKGGTSINHFYEKLLLLKDRMNTATGRTVAEERHRFMEDYLRRFYEEWEGDA